jgi:hypothetical protein
MINVEEWAVCLLRQLFFHSSFLDAAERFMKIPCAEHKIFLILSNYSFLSLISQHSP